nr:hypothetical protein [Curtobacterium herbarum]
MTSSQLVPLEAFVEPLRRCLDVVIARHEQEVTEVAGTRVHHTGDLAVVVVGHDVRFPQQEGENVSVEAIGSDRPTSSEETEAVSEVQFRESTVRHRHGRVVRRERCEHRSRPSKSERDPSQTPEQPVDTAEPPVGRAIATPGLRRHELVDPDPTLVVSPREDQHVGCSVLAHASARGLPPESSVVAELHLHIWERRSCAGVGLPVTNEEVEVVVLPEHRVRSRCCSGISELDGLRELDHTAVRVEGHDALSETLEFRPEVPEVASAVQQDRTVGNQSVQQFPGEALDVGPVPHTQAETRQVIEFAPPDHGVAHVLVVGEVQESNVPVRPDERLQDRAGLLSELLETLRARGRLVVT